MAESTDIKIALTTTADTTGVTQVIDGMEKVKAEEASLQAQRDARTAGATGTPWRPDPAVDQAAVAARREQIRLAREQEQAEQDVTDALWKEADARRANGTAFGGVANEVKKVQAPAEKADQSLLALGRTIQGAREGAQGLTGSLPGLVTALGGSAGVAGVVTLAVIAMQALYAAFDDSAKKAKELEERAAETKRQIGELSTAMAEFHQLDLDESIEKLGSYHGKITWMATAWDGVAKAENAAAISGITDAALVKTAQDAVTLALGGTVNKYREIQALADAAAKKLELEETARREAAAQHVRDEQAKAGLAVSAALDAHSAIDLLKKDAEQETKKLGLLRKQKEELEKMAKLAESPAMQFFNSRWDVSRMNEAMHTVADQFVHTPPQHAGLSPYEDHRANIADGNTAKATLDSGGIDTAIERIEKSLKRTYEKLEKGQKGLEDTYNRAEAANLKAAELEKETGIQQAAAVKSLDSAKQVIQNTKVVDEVKQFTTDAKAIFASVKDETPQGQKALAEASALLAKGHLTRADQSRVMAELMTILADVQAGWATANGSVLELNQAISRLRLEGQQLKADIARLKEIPPTR